MSTCSQSAPSDMVLLHAAPRAAKSADRMDGAIIAGGDMMWWKSVKVSIAEGEKTWAG